MSDISSDLDTKPAVNPADPRLAQAFPTLNDEQISALRPFGTIIEVPEGQAVWSVGAVELCMYVVVSGDMTILDGRTKTPIATHHPGSFSGDVGVLSGQAAMASAVAASPLTLIEIPALNVRSIVAGRADIGEIVLRAFLLRRSMMVDSRTVGPMIVGSRYSPDTLRIREFLTRNRYPIVWEDLESSPNVRQMLAEFQVSDVETPVVVLPDGQLLKVPTNAQLAVSLGINRPVESKIFDLVIVGAGPAGLAAAVYGASEGLSTLLVDSVGPGGQAGSSSRIENYMGFPLGISGQNLADAGLAQAEKFGAQIVVPADVTNINCNPVGGHEVEIEGMGTVECRCVILAPGAQYRRLEAEGLERFDGRGVYYAATYVERVLCGESQVAVVGAGNSAGQAAIYLSQHADHVYLVVRGDDLHKTMSSYLARRIEQSECITVLLNSEITDITGEEHVEMVTFTNRSTKESRTNKISGVFVMIGAVPHTAWLPKAIACDPKGFILTGQQIDLQTQWSLPRSPFLLETSCPGVFAVGDARSNSIKRVASAVGEGSMAVALIHQFLAG